MTSSVQQLLTHLRQHNIRVWREGDKLCYKAPKDTVLSGFKEQLREHKAEILDFLQQTSSRQSTLPLLVPISRTNNIPLSLTQQRLWLIEQLNPNTSLHNIPVAYRLQGVLNIEALERSISEIVRRHEVLRAGFFSIDGKPYQRFTDPKPFPLIKVDLQHLAQSQRELQAKELAAQDAQTPIDLEKGILLRAYLFLLAPEDAIVFINLHHIAADGASLEIFFRELITLYQAFNLNQPSPLPELVIQYADYAHWQGQCLQGELFQESLAYWRETLSGNLPIFQLPIDHPRPSVQTYQGSCERVLMPRSLSDALKAVAQKHSVTLFMLLLSAFKTLLYRYTGQEDLIVGSPVAGRNQVETENLIGFFVNTLVLRTRLSGNLRFSELLSRVKESTLAAYSHQEVPFEKLVELLKPDRDRSRSPLFQVMFALNPPWSTQDTSLKDLHVSSLFGYIHSGTSKFDLSLVMRDAGEGLRMSFEYCSDLFDVATIQRLIGHFHTLLEEIVKDPELPISQYTLLASAEQKQLLVDWNQTTVEFPKDKCIHHLFEAQAERTPSKVAVEYEQNHLTYQELNYRSNQIAHYLQSLGVGPEVLVGICVDRSLEMLIGLLGILKAGGAYVPLDPSYPSERLAFMVEDTQIPVLVTQSSLTQCIPNHNVQILCLDTFWEQTSKYSQQDPVSLVTPENLAYTIYTSGSTGKPKGVQVQHSNVVNLLNSIRKKPGFQAEDILLAVTTISFDIAVSELFLPLMVGAKIVLASQEVAMDGHRLLELLDTCKATFLQPTPATWRLLLAAGWKGNSRLTAISTGEALPQDLAEQLLPKVASLWNLYGPTETTIWSTGYQVESLKQPILIGRPMDNTHIYILDDHLQPVPVGVAGELYIGGAGVARGYLNRPELTAERFIKNPWDPQSEERLYRTGDLVRYRADGNVECLGRIDQQVKLRGFRIELGEIESALCRQAGVKEAAVILRSDPQGKSQLIAYVVPEQDQILSQSKLRENLQAILPIYMVPIGYVLLKALPLTPSGKVDRKALPDPNLEAFDDEVDSTAPKDLVEMQLVAIWENVLGLTGIGIQNSFFDLGGHSLLAVKLVSTVEQTFGKKLHLSTLFESPTIEKLANHLREEPSTSKWGSLVPIRKVKGSKALFLIHDADGELMMYHGLTRYLDPSVSVYGLRPLGREGFPMLHTRISEMISHYIDQIRTVEPTGPYHLGGLCAGGFLAFEIARELQVQGDNVGLVAIFDAADLGVKFRRGRVARARLRSFAKAIHSTEHPTLAMKLVHIINISIQKIGNLTKYEILNAAMKVWDRLRLFLYRYYLDQNLTLPKVLQDISVRKIYFFAVKDHPLENYPGKVVLFRASSGEGDDEPVAQITNDPLFGWGSRALGGVKVFDVPGGHSSMLQEPNVNLIAAKINDYIGAN